MSSRPRRAAARAPRPPPPPPRAAGRREAAWDPDGGGVGGGGGGGVDADGAVVATKRRAGVAAAQAVVTGCVCVLTARAVFGCVEQGVRGRGAWCVCARPVRRMRRHPRCLCRRPHSTHIQATRRRAGEGPSLGAGGRGRQGARQGGTRNGAQRGRRRARGEEHLWGCVFRSSNGVLGRGRGCCIPRVCVGKAGGPRPGKRERHRRVCFFRCSRRKKTVREPCVPPCCS